MPDNPKPEPTPEEARLRRRLVLLDELAPKFAPLSPRSTVIYPSINPEQCDLVRELVEADRRRAVGDLERLGGAS